MAFHIMCGKMIDTLRMALNGVFSLIALNEKRAACATLDKLKAGGMAILPPSPQLKADMKKVGDVMLKEWLDKAGPEGQQLVDAFRK